MNEQKHKRHERLEDETKQSQTNATNIFACAKIIELNVHFIDECEL